MRISEANTARIRGSGCRAIAWILLVTFTLQSFITQTHIHGAFNTGATLAAPVTNAPAHKNAPAENGKAECPFCQAIVHAGAFHAPPAQTLVLPVSGAKMAASFFVAATFVSVSSHLWHSRAPPQH
jgi:hypothetical protein